MLPPMIKAQGSSYVGGITAMVFFFFGMLNNLVYNGGPDKVGPAGARDLLPDL